jgi:hypothetical protein
MAETIKSILFVLAALIFVIVLPFLGLRRLRRARRAREKCVREKQKAAFEERQLHPDFAAFATRYGCEPPPSLLRLYEDRATVLDENFEVVAPSGDPYFVAWFEPMNEPEWPDREGLYSFANDGCGNQFLVNPKESDPEVYFYDHEMGQSEDLGMRLSEFLAAPRIRHK